MKKMNFIALVPARGGSKGLPGKNLMEVQGISLVARAILMAKQIPDISRVILSTDDERIMEEGQRVGGEVPFKRPGNLSRSETPMVRVLEHALEWIRSDMPNSDECLSGLVVLQPTSPMRKPEHVMGAINLYKEEIRSRGKISGVTTVSPVPENCLPSKLFRFKGAHSLNPEEEKKGRNIIKAGFKTDGQLYYRNGAAIILNTNHLGALNTFYPPLIPYIIQEQLVSIDSFHDLMKAEYCGRKLDPDPREINWSPRQEIIK